MPVTVATTAHLFSNFFRGQYVCRVLTLRCRTDITCVLVR
jgi:hypothetical protein